MNDSHGIHVIDTGFVRPRLDAAYLIVEKGRGAFVDCGVNHSVPRLLAALADAGLAPADVDWLILTHVHLDHAGGAGELLRQLPEARLVVHPRGARHMIDPSRLWAGAAAVYGEAEMQRSYGRLVPVPAGRVVEAPDGHEVDLAGRRLICLDTPGHARHHNAIFDPASGWVFSGDTFGVSYREFDTAQGPFIVPATSPSEFDPPALHRSIDRLLALKPAAVCPTHYGPLTPVKRLAADLHEQIDAMVGIGRAATALSGSERHAHLRAELRALYTGRAARHGWTGGEAAAAEWLVIDIELNAQGLGVWLDQAARARST
ncbi:MBL fold metallo-hydrolase [Ottowia pentelensis]|uniref:MBL fold metallo-hydrolase n=1 Tax=Ottowia pentelensis TaxID=511108 RepID=A0ABV6PPP2_9BURK|nr:MBL fold metallo-hydrolase [Ottowia sp.]MBS0402252.1 MBL fold metallo-hydrolase [Pseudomonadota bacterium]HMN56146.1 MBL fold metallo-hydrolase [Ottowia sp.]